MSDLTRRQLLKSGLAAGASSILSATPLAAAEQPAHGPAPTHSPTIPATARERILFDEDWRFALGHASDPSLDFNFGKLNRERTYAKSGHISQATTRFDDSAWRKLDLPHDWAIELPFISTAPAPEHGARPLGREFPATSIGWYRKTFSLTTADKDKRIQIQFDGVYRECTVFLNGHLLTTNFCGYSPFTLDITDWVSTTQPNVIALRVDATLGDGWFYEGAGIYRHVWLIKSAPIHLVEWGTLIRPTITSTAARIALSSEVINTTAKPITAYVAWQLSSPAGESAATARTLPITIEPNTTHTFESQTTIRTPQLWSIEFPNLYTATTTVHTGAAPIDHDTTTFGIRSLRFDPDHGFFLNNQHLKIKGTCCHQDHAGVGAALPDRLQYFRIERLKDMGSNALRTSHNPPTPELICATDKLGMLVLCETRMMDSNPEGLSQLERMVRRFRNHPSIFMWSLGNEEPEQGSERGQRIVRTMQDLAHRLDPTRLCTVAMNSQQGKGISHVVDIQGFNYCEPAIDGVHKSLPTLPIMGTETASTVSTRGIYANDPDRGYVSAYDLNFPKWAATAETWWKFYDEREFLAGGFAWTGFDYRGEPTPYSWPCVSSHFGIMDICGFSKDNFFYYKSWWTQEPTLHLFPHWDWPKEKIGQPISVWCHTNCDEVELFLNNRSQGVRRVERNTHIEWTVPYEPGTLEARGTKSGSTLITRRETTGPAAKIILSADRDTIAADNRDLAILTIKVVDHQGRDIPTADHPLTFALTGPGKLLGTGSGDPSSHESDQSPTRKLFSGLAQALIQSTHTPGTITVEATSPNLTSATLQLTTVLS